MQFGELGLARSIRTGSSSERVNFRNPHLTTIRLSCHFESRTTNPVATPPGSDIELLPQPANTAVA